MLAFVTSLRHPRNSENYAEVESLLADTLGSIVGQTSDEYVVIIVGNQKPSFPLPDRVHFVGVDFPPPVPTRGAHFALEPFRRDKGTKIGVGLVAARAYQPDHVMIFDADDFVHNGVAAYAAERQQEPGWVVDDGWIYSRRRQSYREQPNFYRHCGTSYIVSYDAYQVPEDLTVEADQDEVVEAYGERLTEVIGEHRFAWEWFERHGCPLKPLPFPGAVYHVDTGENHSGGRSKLRRIARPADRRFVQTYGIPRTSRVRALWGAVGPVPLRQSLVRRIRRTLRFGSGQLPRGAR